MSAGRFVSSKYESDSGLVFACRVQPETLGASFAGTANQGGTGDPFLKKRIALSLNHRRRRPFAARYVALRWTGNPPDGYAANQVVKIPVLRIGVFNDITEGSAASYLGSPCEVSYKVKET